MYYSQFRQNMNYACSFYRCKHAIFTPHPQKHTFQAGPKTWTSQPQNTYKLSIKLYAEDLYGLSHVNASAKSELRSCKLHSLALKCSVALKYNEETCLGY